MDDPCTFLFNQDLGTTKMGNLSPDYDLPPLVHQQLTVEDMADDENLPQP